MLSKNLCASEKGRCFNLRKIFGKVLKLFNNEGNSYNHTGWETTMRVTRNQLKRIIQEEVKRVSLREQTVFSVEDPLRVKLQDMYQPFIGADDPILSALSTVMEEIGYGADLKDPARLRSALQHMMSVVPV